MHSFVTSKNAQWRRLIWPTLYILRSRTYVTGSTAAPSINRAVVGSWYWRRLLAHQRTSALSGFDWSLFDFIQPDVSSTHLESFVENETRSAGRHEPYTCVSSAYPWAKKPWLSINEMRSTVYRTILSDPVSNLAGRHTSGV